MSWFDWLANFVGCGLPAMGISSVLLGVAGLAAGAAILCNLPSNPFIPSPERATLQYLASSQLTTLSKDPSLRRDFLAEELWRKNGVVIMAEAQGLSSLAPMLSAHGVQLHAVVHETLGVDDFRPFFKGDIFLDKKRRFYGPKERWMFFSGLVRLSVIQNMIQAYQKGVPGNLAGEGRLLGSVFVIGPGSQGILYEHREKEFGDKANLTEITAAVEKMKEGDKSK